MQKILVIGYGNELRTDDGLGPKIASAIEQEGLPGVEVIIAHQLTPELAEAISVADAVVFIDASLAPPHEIQVQPLATSSSQVAGCVTPRAAFEVVPPVSNALLRPHSSSPQLLLGLAAQVFGKCPPGWWITVPARELGFGQTLSASAQASVPTAVQLFKNLRQAIG